MRINEAAACRRGEKKVRTESHGYKFLLNGTTSEMKKYAAMNRHMALLDSGSTVTVVRKASVLSDVRQV